MRPTDDPSLLTPDQRLAEVASILATGVLRPHSRVAIPASDLGRENLAESGRGHLELPSKTVLSVHNG